MPKVDLTIEEIRQYQPPLTARTDFETFWEETKHVVKNRDFMAVQIPVNSVVGAGMVVRHVSFHGFDETPIKGWLIQPSGQGPFPGLVVFHGYGMRRMRPHRYAHYIMAGIAVLAVDVRGQNGETGDLGGYHTGSSQSWILQGLLDKEEYYFRKVYMDGYRAVDYLCSLPNINPSCVGVAGASQGGALAISTAALNPKVNVAMADVPGMCNLERGIQLSIGSISQVATYLKHNPEHTERVMEVLSYFDLLNHAPNVTCPILVSMAMWDNVCLPSTIYAMYDRLSEPKEHKIYEFNGHEGGGDVHEEYQINWLKRHLF